MFRLTETCSVTQEVKRSRFLAVASPIADEEEAKAFLQANAHADANHNCWAWRLGSNYRFSDDGEPSGTAGKPILKAIEGAEFDQVCVLVTRWFGGILLGSGGLMRAYGGAATACLQAAAKQLIIPSVSLSVDVPFGDLALCKARLLALANVQICSEDFHSEGALITFSIPEEHRDKTLTLLKDLTRGRAAFQSDD